MIQQPLEDLLSRLERERLDADRRYNDALTAVNGAIQQVPALPPPPPAYDASRVADLNRAWNILASGPPVVDRSWRGRLRGFVWRLVGPPLEIQRQFNAALVDHVNRNLAVARALPEAASDAQASLRQAFEGLFRFESLVVQYLMTITAFVDTRDRRLGAEELGGHVAFLEQRIAALTREVDRQRGQAPGPPAPAESEAFAAPAASMTYVGFEDRFRGSQSDIRVRVEDYLPMLAGASDVVDVGCGRGELLDALRAGGVRARGADANHAMVELCRARGLDVEESDAVSFLERQAPSAVGGLVAIQVVEHFSPAYLLRFLAAAHDALRPGAPLILETINPACWSAFFETYIRDPTHQRPLHPDTLKYLVQASGFAQVDLQFRQPVRDADRLDRVSAQPGPEAPPVVNELIAAVNAHADKLNARLFTSFDYAVVARR